MQRISVDFEMHCEASRVYLVVGSGPVGATTVVPMSQAQPGEWNVTVQLFPGIYRYRYYIGNESTLTYYPPADIDGREMRLGMDALRQVDQQTVLADEVRHDCDATI